MVELSLSKRRPALLDKKPTAYLEKWGHGPPGEHSYDYSISNCAMIMIIIYNNICG